MHIHLAIDYRKIFETLMYFKEELCVNLQLLYNMFRHKTSRTFALLLGVMLLTSSCSLFKKSCHCPSFGQIKSTTKKPA
jgi:hypothetical protein